MSAASRGRRGANFERHNHRHQHDDSGPGSLRQALVDAVGGDTIDFSVTGTITLTSGQLFVDKSVAISGPGANSPDYNLLAVKPVDDKNPSIYQNGDKAGTPENFKPFVIGGARGGGGANYTGGYSGSGAVRCTP